MKKRNLKYSLFAAVLTVMALSSCDDFLDTMPDNRAEVDTETKIAALLTSAYCGNEYLYFNETMSDNADDHGSANPYSERFAEQVWNWEDVTETKNYSPERFWASSWAAIAHANEALKAIEDLGGATTATLRELKGEALMCRAYAHFMLVATFCLPYSEQTSGTDLGLPYLEGTETQLLVKYDRTQYSVASVYEKIDRDIQEGLPLVGDSHLRVPKYHFNQRAAYAFAARFYLYYQKWDKVVECANQCLGSNPSTMLRDCYTLRTMVQTNGVVQDAYIDASANCNLLFLTAYSDAGLVFGGYYTNSRHNHGVRIGTDETNYATHIFGSANTYVHERCKRYSGTNLDKYLYWRVSYKFEYTDPVAGIGYRHTVYPAFTTDECLLNRAEAYIMLKEYDKAAEDLNTWMHNFTSYTGTLTPASIQTWFSSRAYAYSNDTRSNGAIKKHLNPTWEIDEEGSVQESMIQCVLDFRRLETLHLGLRWYDLQRYHIEFPRRLVNQAGTTVLEVVDWMEKDDPRRAMQIPASVRDAGFMGNPR